MTGTLQPLQQQFRIVDERGQPTLYFIQWAQQRQIDIGSAITAEQAVQIVAQFLAEHPLTSLPGIALTNGGNIAAGVQISAQVQEILDQISTTQGTVLFRGAADWQALAPGTAGDFLKTNGAGADPAWAAVGGGGGGGLSLIARQVLAAPAANVDFSAIPATYRDLVLVYNARGDSATTSVDLNLRLNNDSGANYDTEFIHWYATGSSINQATGQTSGRIGNITSGTAAANHSSAGRIEIPNYVGTTFFKSSFSDFFSSLGTGGFTQGRGIYGTNWRNTSAVNRVTLLPSAGNLATGSVFSLYGLT